MSTEIHPVTPSWDSELDAPALVKQQWPLDHAVSLCINQTTTHKLSVVGP